MRKISTADIKEHEIINLCGGERLGYPTDFEFDLDDGKILSIIATQCDKAFGFGKREEYIIPWCRIECFGEDTILVKLPPNETNSCSQNCKPKKKNGLFK